jgi:hypothetical protein
MLRENLNKLLIPLGPLDVDHLEEYLLENVFNTVLTLIHFKEVLNKDISREKQFIEDIDFNNDLSYILSLYNKVEKMIVKEKRNVGKMNISETYKDILIEFLSTLNNRMMNNRYMKKYLKKLI